MFVLLLVFLLTFAHPPDVLALYNPLSVPNNTYGIHIADSNDLPNVSPLINSTGGDWGYVTLVLQDNDKNTDKWNGIFDTMRRNHLIPLVRLATHIEEDSWVKPREENIHDMVRFLGTLNWPIENRYIILFNEPNHAKEWGNILDPEDYATVASAYARELKASSQDYFVLPAGLDVSASNSYESMDAAQYLKRMHDTSPELFQIIDGWNSHSYPNPAFSGSPNASGRGTLRTYEWELSYIKSLGIERDLPIFITETGWEHREGKAIEPGLLTAETIASYITEASQVAWNDSRIAAITPFVFSYQDIPFDHFSWKMLGIEGYYAHAKAYQDIKKIRGQPKQHQSYTVKPSILPLIFVSGSTYELPANLKNTGQNVLDSRDGYHITVSDSIQNHQFQQTHEIPYLEPGQEGEIVISLSTPQNATSMHVIISIGRDTGFIVLEEKFIRLVPPPSLSLSASLGFQKHTTGKQAKILVYDDAQKLIHQYDSVPISDGKMTVSELRNIIPGQKYRIVIVAQGYLPRQVVLPLSKGDTRIEFPMLIPFDIDEDGALTINDFVRALQYKPYDIWRRLF
jgi:hypothetical protein